jgi:mRNA interferase MazF
VVVPASGEVVLVPFPFSDLSQSKVRPAVCLADGPRRLDPLPNHEQRVRRPGAVPLNVPDFASGGLRVASFARPGKLFTAHAGLLVRSVGVLTVPRSGACSLRSLRSSSRPPGP